MKKILFIILITISLNADYQNFINSNTMQLVSDSKIKQYKNNKLHANSNIYGVFYSNKFLYQFLNNGITSIDCSYNRKRMYNVVNECKMQLSKTNNEYEKLTYENTKIVYLSKSNAKDINKFDYRTHMIECIYNEKHGIMHDCKKKIYRKLLQ